MATKVKKINIRLFQLYKKVYNDVRVIPGFRVPNNDFWPAYFHGYNLGNYANGLRVQYKDDKSVFDEIELANTTELGFDWTIHTPEIEQIFFACKLYKKKYRHCDVPLTFRVPTEDNFWPDCTHDLKLGDILNNIRVHGFHKPIHRELKRLGFNLDKNNKNVVSDIQKLCDALHAYKRKFTDLDIKRHFVIDNDDEAFPRHTWGMNLGYIVHGVQTKGHLSEHIDLLRDVGLQIDDSKAVQSFTLIYTALATYKSLHGDLLVPQLFKVPHGSPDYPSTVWDMKLGAIVRGIRKKDNFASYREQLVELGFVYGAVKQEGHKPIQIVEID